jgi:hypothetical protein
MLTPGIYEATVCKHWWEEKQSDGSPILLVQVTIFDGTDDYKMTGRIYFSPKAVGMARGQLRELGFDPETEKIVDIGDTISFVGNTPEVTLEEEEWQGRTQLKLTRFGGRSKPPTADAMKAAQQALLAAKGKPAEKKAPVPNAVIPKTVDLPGSLPIDPAPEGDIPF